MPGCRWEADQVRQEWRPFGTQPIKETASRAAVQGEEASSMKASSNSCCHLLTHVVLSHGASVSLQMGVKLFLLGGLFRKIICMAVPGTQ